MTRRGSCVPDDRLAALALGADAPDAEHDRQLVDHVASCESCAARLGAMTSNLDNLRDAAWHEADALFNDEALDAQRSRILDRLAHLGKAARVLHFPGRVREAAMPVSPISRRWVSVAAAAGLIIGLVAGQVIHLLPWDADRHPLTASQIQVTAPRDSRPLIVQASSAVVSPTDEELLNEIDEAMQLRRAASLRALDAFTPRVGDLVEIR